ncbi:PLP-dependent aspartate aminotransferase family protein [Photobacterium sp. 1_MG-2023]|uniref:trans-sulfuration enzyme family protein n=1 Tax=Photobacterium sp. 1_MG-2023 TaxID=3062646 RepID=UPI0026E134A8|nr:PLP-dependent aspartate aminotransferase family protein [Photobacterium sp. 1_MG-2023]MDO6706333.1 PLP-dependent aspartate aminotransferase family protein [Photobacterium sp. 1_MG-2023]
MSHTFNISRCSTVVFNNVEDMIAADQDPLNSCAYGRVNNPTSRCFEEAMATLEHGFKAVTAPSGLSAITMCFMALVRSGGHVLIADDVFGGVKRFAQEVLHRLDIEIEYYRSGHVEDICQRVKSNTQIIYVESPSYFKGRITDIAQLRENVKSGNLAIIADNTWASPCYANPLEQGADISIHSVSKYIGGHSDVVLGVAVCNETTWEKVKLNAFYQGIHVSPDDVYLAWRGLQTLKARMAQLSRSAYQIAYWLTQHPQVLDVYYPALKTHPDHDLWSRLFLGASGRFAIRLSSMTNQEITERLNTMQHFKLGYGWGGYSSLIAPRELPSKESKALNNVTLMLSIGLEDVNNLIDDLEHLLTFKTGVVS